MRVYTLPHPTALERSLAKRLNARRSGVRWITFHNGEKGVALVPPTVPGAAILIGRTAPPSEDLFRTLLLADTLKNAGARRLLLVVPYVGYSRQDRPVEQGDSVALMALAKTFRALGVTTLFTVDLHSARLQGTGMLPVVDLSMVPAMARALSRGLTGPVTVVSPDHGSVDRARLFASTLGGASVAWCEKVRSRLGVKLLRVNGTVKGRNVVIVDDMLDTGETIAGAVKLLRAEGVKRLSLCITHPLFTGDAPRLIRSLKFDRIITTNTIPLSPAARRIPHVKVLDATDLLAQAFQR